MNVSAAAVQQGRAVTTGALNFDKALIEDMIVEYGVVSELPIETQHWLVARVIAAVSLAAALEHDEDYYASIHGLGEGPSQGAEEDFAREVLRLMIADLNSVFESSQNVTTDLMRRLRDSEAVLGLLGRMH